MEIKTDAVKNNIAWDAGMLGSRIKVISVQTGDDKSEHQYLGNQLTKMDRNG